ncbi:MAG: DUF2163 domain-containing protein [Pseudomonadota bacterium]
MKGVSAKLASGASTVCRAWIVKRTDGTEIGFTDHDLPLILDGVKCNASSGLVAGALQMTTGLSIDNSETQGAISHDAITESDLKAGRWDGAEVTSWLVDWSDPESREITFRGHIGEVSWGEGAFSAELRGLSEGLNAVQGRVFQERCDAVLGDSRCRVNLASNAYSVELAVNSVIDNRIFQFSEMSDFAERWFARGRLRVISGRAVGMQQAIKNDRTRLGLRELEAWAGFLAPVEPGDLIRVEAGCDKRHETCKSKFVNGANFRGFPTVPGDDWLMAYPTRASQNDGGRR